jgi:hypothetical protein
LKNHRSAAEARICSAGFTDELKPRSFELARCRRTPTGLSKSGPVSPWATAASKSNGATVDAKRGSRYSRNTGIDTKPQFTALRDCPADGLGFILRSHDPFTISCFPASASGALAFQWCAADLP